MTYFYFLAKFSTFPFLKSGTSTLHPNINYFSEKYMKWRIIPKGFKALAVILKFWQVSELLVIFSHFLAKFGWKHPYIN